MFDYTITHWMTFVASATLLNLSPGPDIAFILGQTLRNGEKHGFSAMFGIWTGAALHVVMAAVGLSAILATSALAFSMVKWAGAAYLIWLGIKLLRSRGDSFWPGEGFRGEPKHSVYWQGILVSTLNPKVAIFFLAFLPQFVVEGAGSPQSQLLLHGSLIIGVAALVEPPLVLFGAKLRLYLTSNQRVGLWLDRGLGAMFVCLGARLATSGK